MRIEPILPGGFYGSTRPNNYYRDVLPHLVPQDSVAIREARTAWIEAYVEDVLPGLMISREAVRDEFDDREDQ
jgi:hypothetical protein